MAFRTNKMPILQSKTASGAVATFNTALAMPVASCNIAVNAWQEGSGDPSPDNVRPIHGFSEVNATRAGKIQFNIANSINDVFLSELNTLQPYPNWNVSDYQIVKPNTTYHFKPNSTSGGSAKHGYYDKNKNFIGYTSSGEQTFTTPSNAYYMRFSYRTTSTDIMLNFGSTALPYEPYVTPTIYTKSLGEEVFGGSYNSVSGVKSKTLLGKIYNGSEDWQDNGSNGVYLQLSNDERALFEYVIMCNEYKPMPTFSSIENLSVKINSGRTNLLVKDENRLSASSFKSFLTDNPMLVVYKLYDPIESNIGATPILTNIGNNTIFADTGDVDLTYKDLDIAKRGNFREVFKLPS